MGSRIIGILAAAALIAPMNAASAAPKSSKLAKCDGKQRRPANPSGSILPSVDPIKGTSAPASPAPGPEPDRKGVEVFLEKSQKIPKAQTPKDKTEHQVPAISGRSAPKSNQSC